LAGLIRGLGSGVRSGVLSFGLRALPGLRLPGSGLALGFRLQVPDPGLWALLGSSRLFRAPGSGLRAIP